jgi:hypothetical protein
MSVVAQCLRRSVERRAVWACSASLAPRHTQFASSALVPGGAAGTELPRPLRVLFFGTDEVSLPSLVKLHAAAKAGTLDARGRTISADGLLVVCPADVRAGRKRTLQPVPVKQYCLDHGIAFTHPPPPPTLSATPASADGWIPDSAGEFDVGMVVSFGHMIPESVLQRLPYGAVNLHPSLLPRYRGAAPVPRCLLNGDPETGTSIIRVTAKKFDSGDVLLQRRYALTTAAAAPAVAPLTRTLSDAAPSSNTGGTVMGRAAATEEEGLGSLVASDLLAVLAERGADDLLTVLLDLDRFLNEEARCVRACVQLHARVMRVQARACPRSGAAG